MLMMLAGFHDACRVSCDAGRVSPASCNSERGRVSPASCNVARLMLMMLAGFRRLLATASG